MSLLDDIKGEGRNTGTVCSVAVVLNRLTGQDKKDFLAALADPGIPATNIARALTKRGVFEFRNGDAITRHRRRDCRCDPR